MLHKLVIAFDSFKGSVGSARIARHLGNALTPAFPGMQITGVPVSDGGEGLTTVLLESCGGRTIRTEAHDPLMNPIIATYGILGDGCTAVIETAQASGLTRLEPTQRNPMPATTYGTGELILDALQKGCTRIILGVGGSATNDAGLGLLQALGFRFLDRQNKPLFPTGNTLAGIKTIDTNSVTPLLSGCTFTLACDVDNPLYGPSGAAYMYAPQKGATPEQVATLDRSLQHIARVIGQKTGTDIARMPGAGAAGGLAGSCAALLDGQIASGIDTVLDTIGFDRILCKTDLVITGEGRLDRQTVRGKVPAGILRAAQKQNIPVVALGGSIEWCAELRQAGFAGIFPILSYPVSLQEAMAETFTLQNITETAIQVIHYHNRIVAKKQL